MDRNQWQARADSNLRLRNVTADGFEARPGQDGPWIAWRREAWSVGKGR